MVNKLEPISFTVKNCFNYWLGFLTLPVITWSSAPDIKGVTAVQKPLRAKASFSLHGTWVIFIEIFPRKSLQLSKRTEG